MVSFLFLLCAFWCFFAYIQLSLSHTHTQQPQHFAALQVREAVALGNFHAFFRLYRMVPNIGNYMLDRFADRMRKTAVQKMVKA